MTQGCNEGGGGAGGASTNVGYSKTAVSSVSKYQCYVNNAPVHQKAANATEKEPCSPVLWKTLHCCRKEPHHTFSSEQCAFYTDLCA